MSRQRSVASAGPAGAAPVFAALGDETRLRLVAHLCTEGPLSRLQTARRYLDRISGQWDDTLERLRAFVEG